MTIKNKDGYDDLLIAIVKKYGSNNGHIVLPASWIDQEVEIKLLKTARKEAFDKAMKKQKNYEYQIE